VVAVSSALLIGELLKEPPLDIQEIDAILSNKADIVPVHHVNVVDKFMQWVAKRAHSSRDTPRILSWHSPNSFIYFC